MDKYRELCGTLLEFGYTPLTVGEFLEGAESPRVVILRHDIDRKPSNALKMAELEQGLGISATYYFRYPYTFRPEIIRKIHSMGHEVGYHYEVLSKAKGDHGKAIQMFEKELSAFREVCEISTICMHGSPLSRYDNRDLWNSYDFRDCGLKGEAYLSMAGKNLLYLTDTGRNWSGKNSIRDMMPGAEAVPVETTDDLVGWIGSLGKECIYLTVHPERWALSEGEWAVSYSWDVVTNFGKIVLAMVQ